MDHNDVQLVNGDDHDNSRTALRPAMKGAHQSKAGHSANLRVPGIAFNELNDTTSNSHNGVRAGTGGIQTKPEQYEDDDTDEEMGQVHDEGDVKVKHVDV